MFKIFCSYITEQNGRVRFIPDPRIVSTFSRENEYEFTDHVQYFRDSNRGLYFLILSYTLQIHVYYNMFLV